MIRLIGLCGLIVAQGLILAISFDSSTLAAYPPGWWTPVFHAAPSVMTIGALIGTAAALVAWPRGWLASPSGTRQGPRNHRHFWLLLLGQLLAFGALFALTDVIFGDFATALNHPGTWVAGWLLAVAATGLFWLSLLVPPATWGTTLRQFWWLVPIAVAIAFAAWQAGRYTQNFWKLLPHSTLIGAYTVLRVVDSSAWADFSRLDIGAGNFAVKVDPNCSGYEGIGLVCVFLPAYFLMFRRRLRFPHVWMLIPIAAIAVWIANSFRIAALVWIGAHISPGIALGGFHSYAGILLFCTITLICVAITQRMTFFSRRMEEGAATYNPAAPYLVPFLALTVTALLTALTSSGGPDRLYPIRVLVALAALWYFRTAYKSIRIQIASGPLAVGAIVFVLWIFLGIYLGLSKVAAQPLPFAGSYAVVWLAFRTFGAVVTVPIVEELAFRGYLARRLMASEFDTVPYEKLTGMAIAVSSIVFALLHGRLAVGGMIAGVAYAWITKRRGNLGSAMLAHATTNGLLAVYVLATKSWWLWN